MDERRASRDIGILGTERVGKLLRMFSIPSIICLVVNSIYNMVDQIFIGWGVGYLGNGATNVIFPLTVVSISFGMLVGDGAASYFSLKLGEGRPDEAARGAASAMISVTAIGVLLGVIYLIFLKPLCLLFGATELILPYAMDYGRIIALGIPFCTVCCGFSGLMRADGSPRYSMAGMLVGCAINLIGDPLFIFVFHWGVKGAAWATILGQIANAVFCFVYIGRFKSVSLDRAALRGCFRSLGSVLKLGLSSFITQFAVVFVITVQNKLMVKYGAQSVYGAEIPMTALGVTMKVFSVLNAAVFGLASGAQPILGYNYGSGRIDRVKKTYKLVLLWTTAILVASTLLFQLAPMSVVRIFGSESELYNDFAVKCLRIFLMLIAVNGFQMVSCIFFQAIGKPTQATILSLARQICFQIPLTFLFTSLMGVVGALWVGPAGDLLAAILAAFMFARTWKRLGANAEQVQRLPKND